MQIFSQTENEGSCRLDLSRYDAIFFDVDGTLSETEKEGHLPAFNLAFKKHQIAWRWSPSIYKVLLKIAGGYERLQAYRSFVETIGKPGGNLKDEQLKEIHLSKNEIYAHLIQEGAVSARTGLIRMLNYLDGNQKPWGIVTTTSRSNWEVLWHSVFHHQVCAQPMVVICGEEVTKKKPDPEAYILAAKKIGADPNRCLAIEDSCNGVASAHGAGMDVLVVKSFFFSDEDFDHAKWVVGSFDEIALVNEKANT
jgi:HAD superfamily hydrolase (TIGR01509 family)